MATSGWRSRCGRSWGRRGRGVVGGAGAARGAGAAAVPGAIRAVGAVRARQLPAGEPALSEFIDAVRQAAVRLGPQERAYVPLPVRLLLRKTTDSGGVVSVTGGLNPHWARFTERCAGRTTSTRRGCTGCRSRRRTSRSCSTDRRTPRSSWRPGRSRRSRRSMRGRSSGSTARAASRSSACRRSRRMTRAGGAAQLAPHPRRCRPGASRGGRGARALVLLGYYAADGGGRGDARRCAGYDPSLYAGIDFVCAGGGRVGEAADRLPVGRRVGGARFRIRVDGERSRVCKACGHPYDHHIFGGMCRDCDCRRCKPAPYEVNWPNLP